MEYLLQFSVKLVTSQREFLKFKNAYLYCKSFAIDTNFIVKIDTKEKQYVLKIFPNILILKKKFISLT